MAACRHIESHHCRDSNWAYQVGGQVRTEVQPQFALLQTCTPRALACCRGGNRQTGVIRDKGACLDYSLLRVTYRDSQCLRMRTMYYGTTTCTSQQHMVTSHANVRVAIDQSNCYSHVAAAALGIMRKRHRCRRTVTSWRRQGRAHRPTRSSVGFYREQRCCAHQCEPSPANPRTSALPFASESVSRCPSAIGARCSLSKQRLSRPNGRRPRCNCLMHGSLPLPIKCRWCCRRRWRWGSR